MKSNTSISLNKVPFSRVLNQSDEADELFQASYLVLSIQYTYKL